MTHPSPRRILGVIGLLRISRRARALACLLLLLAVSAVTATSGATFTGSSDNPRNTFSSGTLSLTNSKGGGYILSAKGIRPGQSVSGTLTLTSAGDYETSVSAANLGITNTPASPALASALTFLVEDTTGTPLTLWTGKMSAFSSVSLGRFVVGESRTYRITLTFPQAAATPGLQGAGAVMTLRITGAAL
jgi:hypothetical protein